MKQFYKLKMFILGLTLIVIPQFLQSQTVVSAFAERLKINGQLEIRMIGAPSIEPAYIDATAAAANTIKVDSLMPYETILKTGPLLTNNNSFQWPSTVNIPQTVSCPAGSLPCASAYSVTANKNCPMGKWSSSPTVVSKTVSLAFADYDTDKSTFSSSRATFQMSGCQCKVKKAYLYWFGCEKNITANVLISTPTASYTGSGDVNKVSSSFKTVLFKAPGGAYTPVTADVTYNGLNSVGAYVCLKDVTSLLSGVAKGDVWVANIQSFLGKNSGGSFAGWSLVLIYESPNYPPRSISLWDGFFELNGSSKTISLTGLTTPASTNFKSYIGFGCLDGENFGSRSGLTPENLNFKAGATTVQINPMKDRPYMLYSNKGEPDGLVKDACNMPVSVTPKMVYDGVSSSHITSYDEIKNTNGNEINRTPAGINTIGIDLHHILLPQNAISPSATQADLTFFSGEQGGTMPFLSYIAIETLQPKLELSKSANVVKTALNSTITYSLTVKNTGGLKSVGVNDKITDALDAGIDYVPNSAKYMPSGTPVAGVTLSGNIVSIPIKAINSGESLTITFDVKVKDYSHTSVWLPNCKDRITNLAWIEYYSPEGILYKNISNATACDIGSETLVWIDDTQLGNSNVINIGPIDITTWSTDSLVVANVRRHLVGKVATNLIDSFLVIDEKTYLRMSSNASFDRVATTQSYKLVFRNGAGSSCMDSYRVTYQINAKPTFTQDTVAVRCWGEKNGTIQATASYQSGAGTIKYTAVKGVVSNAAQFVAATAVGSKPMSSVLTYKLENLSPGDYTIVAEDAGGNLYYLGYTVIEPKQFKIGLAAEDSICVGQSANASVSILSGLPVYKPYKYSWKESVSAGVWTPLSNTTDNITKSPTTTTSYAIMVTDSACVAHDTVTVKVNALPIISLKDTTICDKTAASIDAGTHGKYVWSTTETTQKITPTSSGNYSVTVNDRGCESVAIMKLNVTPLPIPNLGLDRAVCDSVTLRTGGTFDSYKWSSGQTTASLYVTATGKYAVEVSKTGCSARDTVEITVYQTPNFTIGADTAICPNEQISLNAGNYAGTYLWSTSESTQKISVNKAGTYSVTVSIGSNCTSSASRKVSIKPVPKLSISGNTPICPGETASIVVSGADTYLWNDASTSASRSLQPTASTIYKVIGTINNCSADTSFTLSVKAIPTVVASNDETICWGKSTTISVSGTANNYAWDNGLGNGISFTFQPTSNTKYKVTGTLNGCSKIDSVLITVNPKIIVKPSNDTAICKGDAVTLLANGENVLSFAWDNGLDGSASHVVTPLSTTKYSVTASYNSCTAEGSVLITVNELPVPVITSNATNNTVCDGESVTLSTTNTFKEYQWIPSATSATISVNKLGKTDVNLTVTDNNGCHNTTTSFVMVNKLPNPVIVSSDNDNVVCVGESVVLSTSETFKEYNWATDITSTQASISISKLGKSNISLLVTDNNNCKNTTTSSVTINALPVPTIVSSDSDNTVCVGESITLSSKDQYKEYKWETPGIETTSSISISKQGKTDIQLTVTDLNNCKNTTTGSVIINELPKPVIASSDDNNKACDGETINLSTTDSYQSYKWVTGESTASIAISKIGTHQIAVEVTDNNQCKGVASTEAIIYKLPNIVVQGVSLCAGNQALLNASGADSYNWSDGVINNQVFAPSATKTYTVTGTDANGCKNTTTALVTVNPQPTISAANQSVCEGKSTSLIGQGGVNYQWSDGVVDNTAFTPSVSKTYSVTGTDAKGCKNTATATVTVNPLPKPVFVSSDPDNSVCDGETVTLSTKESYDKYQWNPTSSNATIDINSLGTNNVSLTVTDVNGCTNSITTIVTVHEKPFINIPPQSSFCDKANINAEVKNVEVSTYSWSTLETTKSIEVTKSQAYSVTITSTDKCTASKTVNPVIYETPHPQLPAIQSICQERTAQLKDASAAKGQTYLWYRNDTAQTNTSNILTNLSIAGTYKLVSKMGNCSGEATSQLIVYRLPELISGKKDICFYENSQTITLEGASANWYADIDTTQVLQRNSLIYTPILNATQDSVVLFATITDTHGCVSHLKTMTVRRIPEYKGLQILGDTLRCANQKTGIIYRAVSYLDGIQWNAPHAYDIYKPDGTAIMLRLFNEGLDTLILSTTDAATGCVYSTKKVIYTSPMPQADFDWQAQTGNMSIHFVNRSDSSVVPEIHKKLSNTYQWTFWKADELWKTAKHKDTTLIYPYGYHDAQLVVTNQYGCKDSIKKTVFMDVNIELFMPNVFYPDHDSKEIAEFRPKGMCLEHYELSIYDQWGNLLWHSTKLINGHPAEGWDGTYEGNTMKSDTYIWKMKAKFTNGNWLKTKDGSDIVFGSVLLLR